MAKLFGTDGIRGVFNQDITFGLAYKIGKAAATVLIEKFGSIPKIIVGKDTRISSDIIECAIVGGICSVGANAEVLGIIPTPAVAILVKNYNADAGIMISASHNPIEFNGIKIFDSLGYKLSEELEEKIETIILDNNYNYNLKTGVEIGRVIKNYNACDDYIDYITSNLDFDLTGIKLAIDCGNGSASVTAEKLFSKLGVETFIINDKPDGTNINKNCGSTHIDGLIDYMKKIDCDLGVAFDGDADRCLAVDENGNIIDGDNIIAILSKYLKDNNRLKNNTVVVTVMSNLGFINFAKNNDILVKQSKVGDKYVLEEMLKGDYILGGEQSGHIIFLDYCTTGDGQLSAIQLLNALKKTNKKLSQSASIMKKVPQVTINVDVDNKNKIKLNKDKEINQKIDKYSKLLGDNGRILVRASGTEPLVRVMIEGFDLEIINKYALDISESIKERLS